ncbi:DUF4190 domain-containing protein [Corynebacterium sp. sy017]|uniref:DUF4190 domain-containing protein n=1 Tax=unclassified Corynebacterium TaxID=2624378 RepID=UPI0011852446|nr:MULTISPECIES: DUF4190 domain-containing protein [unclassified Corynebacterium]MBP3087757.1 DUF4190 domain-containing protein [Corynebacterium sp. sy017]QDZ42732.1 DUF4190 domain-containing protein [Corynebacterium sp. sy039]TSD92307.1 DUF4190 domain-containing protein [Corynebacterium sp. SY003]
MSNPYAPGTPQPNQESNGSTASGYTQYQENGAQGITPGTDANTYSPYSAAQPQPLSGYPASYRQPEVNALAPWAMGIGIASLFLGVTILLPIAGLVLSILALRKAAKMSDTDQKRKGMAITGLVTSIISLIITAIVAVFFTMFVLGIKDEVQHCDDITSTQQELDQCIEKTIDDYVNG